MNRRTMVTTLGASLAVPGVAFLGLGGRSGNRYSLMDVLDRAERLDLLAGDYDPVVLTKMTALMQSLPEGSVLDASMVHGNWIWGSDPFGAAVGIAPFTLMLGEVAIRKNFNTGAIFLPSLIDLRCYAVSIAPTEKIEAIPSDANPSTGLLATHVVGGVLSGTGGGNSVTLDYANDDRLMVGASLAVFGAVPLPEAEVTLSRAIDADDTVVTFATDVNHVMQGLAYIKVDNEVILGSVSGTSMAVRARGANGTTAANHSEGAEAVLMIAKIFRVTAKAGSVVTLDESLPYTLTNARWRAGSVDTKVRGRLTIDGKFSRSDLPSNNWNGLTSTLGRGLKVEGEVRIARCVHGGLNLTGARDADIQIERIEYVGRRNPDLGCSIWLFGDNQRNRIRVRSIDDGSLGVAFDNKSFGVTEYGLHAPSNFNRVEIDQLINTPYSANFSGASDNYLGIRLSSAAAPVMDNGASQLTKGIHSRGNVVVIDRQTSAGEPTGVSLTLNRVFIGGTESPSLRPSDL